MKPLDYIYIYIYIYTLNASLPGATAPGPVAVVDSGRRSVATNQPASQSLTELSNGEGGYRQAKQQDKRLTIRELAEARREGPVQSSR